jgi:hypothetical protein
VQSVIKLIFAMALRVVASVCYVGLIAFVTAELGASKAAEIVYLFAVSFVSANLGRFGADQQIAKSAKYFRNGYGIKAGSLIATHTLFCVTLVPFLAALIHFVAGPAIAKISADQIGSLSAIDMMFCAAGLALSQTSSAAWQASAYPSASVLVFPLLSYFLLGLFCFVSPEAVTEIYSFAFVLPGLAGLLGLLLQDRIRLMPPRFNLLRGNIYFYAMGLSFYLAVWLPFVYLPSLLAASTVVMLNHPIPLPVISCRNSR